MASHGRRKSRGSMSIFSVDTIRSFSRTGTHQVASPTTPDFGRSPSSLSYCDPHNQPPATPAQATPSVSIAPSPHNSTDALTTARYKNQENESASSQRFTRPSSWFPFGKERSSPQPAYPRSFSERFRLPRGQSSISVAKSTISAPVLTSTTNVKVANSEGVHCGEFTQDSFDTSTWNGKLGWVSNDDKDRSTAVGGRSVAERVEAVDTFQLTPAARLHKMGEAVRDKFRRNKSSDQLRFRAIAYSNVDEMGESSNQNVMIRNAETVNLCKEKIRALTGSTEAHASNYTTRILRTTAKPGAEQEDPPLLAHDDNKSAISSAAFSDHSHSHYHHVHNNECSSQLCSLTRSFNGTVDKGIDTETTNMDFIRKQAAKLGIRSKRGKERDRNRLKASISDPVAIESPTTGTEDQRAHLEQRDKINPLAMHADVEAVAKAPAGKRESVLDMMQFLKESEEKGAGEEKERK